MSMVNIGIVGCGKICRDAHIPNYLEMKNIHIKALCDTNKEATMKIISNNNLNANYYDDYLEMMEKEDLDFIDICTPGFTHYQICKDAIKNSINFITEKPPSLTLENFLELYNLSIKYNIKTGVVMNYRFKDNYLKLKQYIDSGKIGEVKKIQTIHHGPFVYNDASWLWDEKKSYYLLYEYGIHNIDLQTYYCGEHEKVVSVNASYNDCLKTTTDLQIIIKYKNGALGLIDLTADSTKHSSNFSWLNLYGSGSDAFIRNFPPSLQLISGIHNPIDIFNNELKNNISIATQILQNKFRKNRIESHKIVLENYINSIVNNEEFQLSFGNLKNTMLLLEDIKKSIPSYQQ